MPSWATLAAGTGDETLDPRRSLLSEIYPGTLAERVRVPALERRGQACGAVVRGGRVPADRVADGVSHDRGQVGHGAR